MRRRAGIRAPGLFALVAAAVMATGCAAAPAAPVRLDDVARERAAVLESAALDQFDAFMYQSGDRLSELGLPAPSFQGIVPLSEHDAIVSRCIIELDPRLQVSRLEGGFTVNYFGTVGESYERIRWTIESCSAQYGIADLRSAALSPGPVESAWMYHDATQRLLPCLRGIGVVVPTPPDAAAFAQKIGTPLEFNAFSFVVAEPATLARAVALCPPSATVLEAHLEAAPLDLSPTDIAP